MIGAFAYSSYLAAIIGMLNGVMTSFLPQLNSPPICRRHFRRKVIRACMSVRCENRSVGVIGGLSTMTTLMFLEKLANRYVPFIVCSDPVINGKVEVDKECVISKLREKRVFLEESGAKCIVMPCHISHVWQAAVSDGCSIPFLDVGDCVVEELKKAKLKPLEAGSNVRIGVLTTHATLVGGFYQQKLHHQGYEGVLADKPTMEHIILPVVQAMERRDMEGARNLLRVAIHVLSVRGVNCIILAANEFQGLLPHNDPLLTKCIDPMDVLATSTITCAQSLL